MGCQQFNSVRKNKEKNKILEKQANKQTSAVVLNMLLASFDILPKKSQYSWGKVVSQTKQDV